MSTQLGKLCSALLLELFGDTVQKVGDDLFKWSDRPLSYIVKTTGLPLSEVKKALCILIQYGFASYCPSNKDPNKALYTLLYEKVLLVIRYPKYLLLIKTKYGDETEMLVEELLRQGQDIASSLILRASSRFKETTKNNDATLSSFRDKFVALVNDQFLMRCLYPCDATVNVPVLAMDDRELFLLPNLNMPVIAAMEKDSKHDGDPGDKNILWEINFDRFNQEIRDEVMVKAVTRRIDENAGELMRFFFKEMYCRTDPWEDVSNPIPFNVLKEEIKRQNKNPKLIEHLEAYCMVIEQDACNFISKYGDSGGGQYTVNIEQGIKELTWATLENIVLERFGSKAARIFRIVKEKKKIDQDQIQPLAMIPAKEAKSLTYLLLGENFIQMEELRKTLSGKGPVKTFFLFHIDLNQLTRMILEMSYKAVYNAMTRREYEVIDNKRLIDKHNRIKAIVQNMRLQGASEEQIVEVEEMITPIEVSVVEKVEKMVKGFSGAELQVDNTIFILRLYILFTETRNKKGLRSVS